MERLNEIATLFYDVAKDYKDYFCKLKDPKKIEREKRRIEKYLVGFYNSQQLYNFVKEDKETSINEIKEFITNDYGILRLYNIIESNISTTEDLDNIDVVYQFLYDVMSLEECCEIAIKKYGKEYEKYCDLYIRMQKVQKDLLDYLKEVYKDN